MEKIFSATYSGVPVFEFIIPTGSVMRRKADGWVNATHILKTANFPKAKRTRILERDVQTGEHEKVQGGYGKYQGTWVPLARAMDIAKEFNVLEILLPLLKVESFFGSTSPPPAPKHRHEKSSSVVEKPPSQRKAVLARKTASMPVIRDDIDEPTKRRGRPKKSTTSMSNPNEGVFVGKRHVQSAANLRGTRLGLDSRESEVESSAELDINDGIESDVDDGSSINLMAPSSPSEFLSEADLIHALKSPSRPLSRSARESLEKAMNQADQVREDSDRWIDSSSEYTGRLLEYFMQPDDDNTDSKVPEFLLHPPKGFDIDQVIDEEGHTAFHWACAMGNPQVAEVLIKLGANHRAVNNGGETALMKAVQFTNSFSKKTYPKVVSLVTETMFEFDATHRTVLHHIAASASAKSRVPSALYYMDILLAKVADSQSSERLESFLNLQDNNGDTVLHLCAKNANRKCIKLLLNYKAKTNIRNNQGLIASDILLENGNVTPRVQQRYEMHLLRGRNQSRSPEPVAEPHISEAAIEATHKVSQILVESLKDLSNAYDNELERKESDAEEVTQLLINMEEDIAAIQEKTNEFLGEALNNEKLTKHLKTLEEQVRRHKQLAQSKETKLKRLFERSQKKVLEKAMAELERDTTVDKLEDPLACSVELTKLQVRRERLRRQILDFHGGFHLGGKMQKYRRLISASADIPINDVSEKLEDLLKEIENES